MAFNGELEHLSVVDIIQLLYTTKKSGVLSVKGEKGECRIVFSEGRIIGANYLNSRIRIGHVLVKMGVITPEDRVQALEAQEKSGDNRKSMIVTLVELGKIKKEEAFKSLQKLVEMTVVELISWTRGTFTLDPEAIYVSDQCIYSPDRTGQEIFLDAQMVLMDALRMYDEKKLEGESEELLFSAEELAAKEAPREVGGGQAEDLELTADDLGLADIDKLERKIPQVFTGIKVLDPDDVHRQKIAATIGELPAGKQEELVAFLTKHSEGAGGDVARMEGVALGIIIFSRDELLVHSISSVGRQDGVMSFSTGDEGDLDPIIDSYRSKGIVPLLVFDGPDVKAGELSSKKMISLQQRTKKKYPQVAIVQLNSSHDYAFCLKSLKDGARVVIPRPPGEAREVSFVADTIRFLETFRSYTKSFLREQEEQSLHRLRRCILDLKNLEEAPDISYSLLKFVSGMLERAVTLVVRNDELIAERSIGLAAEGGAGRIQPLKLRIPLTRPSVLGRVVEEGRIFFGPVEDDVLQEHLYSRIGAPGSNRVLLLPMRSRDRTIALTYGDFGGREDSGVRTDTVEILADHAELLLENSLCRKQLES